MTVPTKKVKIQKGNRPDGLSVDRYKGHETWSYRRWAWEFLRRDDDFIRACAAVDRNERTEPDVAKEFHLSKFKHCNMGFKSKKSPAPRYTVQAIKKWANVNNSETNSSQVRLKAELEPGQVLLRFDLNQELIVGGSLDAQLRVAKRTLEKTLTAYLEAAKKKRAPKKKPERKSFLELLRRLDAVAGHDYGAHGLAVLQPDDFLDLDSTGSSKKMDSLMRTPREYAKRVYLSLAIHTSQ
jgi:hypothetical protein